MKVIFHRGNIKPYYRSLGKDTFLSKKQETLVDPKASDSTPKMTILIHSRSISFPVRKLICQSGRALISTDDPSIDDRCYVVQENITEGEVIRTEGKKYLDQNETEMTPEELQRFEEDWSKLWKPRAELY